MLNDPFNRNSLPTAFSRADRVRLIGEFFEAVRDGREPSIESRVFTVNGALAWLERDGDLLGQYWKIRGRKGSTHTPSILWRSIRNGSSERATSLRALGNIDIID